MFTLTTPSESPSEPIARRISRHPTQLSVLVAFMGP